MATRLHVDPREFVLAWQMSEDIQEVKTLLGLQQEPNRQISARASAFRMKGVPLKRMRHSTRYDYVLLSEIVAWATDLANQGESKEQITVARFLQERGEENGNV